MTKKRKRKLIRSKRIQLQKAAKLTRTGNYVAVVYTTAAGVEVLCTMFRPQDSNSRRKHQIWIASRILAALNHPVTYHTFREYPIDFMMEEGCLLAYKPHAILRTFLLEPKTKSNGWYAGAYYTNMFRGTEEMYRAALAVCIEEDLLVVTQNGFIWWKDVAREVLGEDLLTVSPKELYR